MSFITRTLRRVAVIAPLTLLATVLAGCSGEYPQTTFQPVTELGARINDVYFSIFGWTMLILGIVLVVLAYVLIRYRERPGAEPRKIYGNNLAEIGWTLGPAIIVVLILVPTVRTIFYTYEPAPEGALIVEAVGHQWWWEFRYPELGVTTANEVILPVDRPVEIRLSSADVIHNWWVPRLGGKRYNHPVAAMATGKPEPNNYKRINFTIEEPGEYLGQCAEFCGESHALMRMLVNAVEEHEFDAWIERMRAAEFTVPEGVPAPGVQPAAQEAPTSLEARGYQVFLQSGCAACHSIAGTPFMGRLGPDLTSIGERWMIGAGTLPNTPEAMANWIRNSAAYKPGSKMLSFPNISEEDMTALVAYLYSLK